MYEFTDRLMSKARLKGITTGAELARACKIPERTAYRRLNDEEWSRSDLMKLHKVLRFDQEDIECYLGKELRG